MSPGKQKREILHFLQRFMETLQHILYILFEGSDHTLAFALAVYSK